MYQYAVIAARLPIMYIEISMIATIKISFWKVYSGVSLAVPDIALKIMMPTSRSNIRFRYKIIDHLLNDSLASIKNTI